jgi:hypothetical protein
MQIVILLQTFLLVLNTLRSCSDCDTLSVCLLNETPVLLHTYGLNISYLYFKYAKNQKITHLAISTYKTDNKMKNLKYQTVGIVPNFNRKVVYKCNIDTAKTAIIMTANIPGLLRALQQNVAGYI